MRQPKPYAPSDADNELVNSIGIDLHIFLNYFIEFNHFSFCQQTQPITSAPTRHSAMYLSQRTAVELLSVAGRRSIDSNYGRFAFTGDEPHGEYGENPRHRLLTTLSSMDVQCFDSSSIICA